MANTHVVYAWRSGEKPIGDAPVKGFGKSDQQALADAKKNAWARGPEPMIFYFVRSNGDLVLCGNPLAGCSTALRAARRHAGYDALLRARYGKR